MHQRNILVEAFDPSDADSQHSLATFDDQLTKLFGTAFTSIESDPIGKEQVRRKWDAGDTAGKQRRSTQTEQRIVDVTLRDLLSIVRSMDGNLKAGWPNFLAALTLEKNWKSVVEMVEGKVESHDKSSGYFWASMLAATAGALESLNKQSPTCKLKVVDIESFPSSVLTDFKRSRHPRAGTGKTVKLVKEMANSDVVNIGANAIAAAWNNCKMLSPEEKYLILTVVGSAVSPDLWHHPAAVRYLLIPAVTNLRNFLNRDKPSTNLKLFSLDSNHLNIKVESLIAQHLGSGWQHNKAW